MYKKADAVLVCSRNEAWGRVAAEAMISGTPVIGFNNCGTKEIITDHFNELLYKNVNDFTNCMKTLIQDKDLGNTLVTNAKNYALKKFSSEEYTTNILNIILKVMK